MGKLITLVPAIATCKPQCGAPGPWLLFLIIVLAGFTAPVRAADGCKALLCLAAPSWRDIPLCVPTVQQVLRDLSLGRPFPPCPMSGSGNSASNEPASAPANCPPQYTQVLDGESAPIYSCTFDGAVSVGIKGVLWSRTWWNVSGETATEFTPAAKAQLGTWNTRFDDDYAAWAGASTPCTTC